MKRAFTLIEVVIAVYIAVIAVYALYSVYGNLKHMFVISDKKKEFALYSSVVPVEGRSSGNLYEALREFNITNDEIIRTLKKVSLKTEKKEIFSRKINIDNLNIIGTINSIKVYNSTNSVYYYNFGLKIE